MKNIIKYLKNMGIKEVNMKCKICNKDILDNSHYIKGKYYHNDCIEKLEEENKSLQSQLKAKEEVIKEAREYARKEIRFVNMQEYHKLDEILSKGENK